MQCVHNEDCLMSIKIMFVLTFADDLRKQTAIM